MPEPTTKEILSVGLRDFALLPEPQRNSRDNRYFDTKGRVIVMVTDVKVGFSNKLNAKVRRYCAMDLQVVEVMDGQYKEGEIRTWFSNLENVYAQKSLRSFAASIAKVDEIQVDMEMLSNMLAASSEREGVGSIIGERVELTLVPTKKGTINPQTNEVFVNPRWYPAVAAAEEVPF